MLLKPCHCGGEQLDRCVFGGRGACPSPVPTLTGDPTSDILVNSFRSFQRLCRAHPTVWGKKMLEILPVLSGTASTYWQETGRDPEREHCRGRLASSGQGHLLHHPLQKRSRQRNSLPQPETRMVRGRICSQSPLTVDALEKNSFPQGSSLKHLGSGDIKAPQVSREYETN